MISRIKLLTILFGTIGIIILSGCSSNNGGDDFVDWTKDMHIIGETVGSYETTDMQIIVRNVSITRVDGSNKLVLSVRMANNTPYYIQLYNGNFNVYDHSLGKDSYPLQVYGMNAGYSYFPLGDEYSRLPAASNYGINSVDFYLAFNISSSTDINNLYLAVNLGDIDYLKIQFYSIYLGNGALNIEDNEVKVSFITNSDSTLPSKTVQYESEYGSLPTIEKTGYEFEGWYLNDDFSGQKVETSTDVKIKSDHILYAKWVANTYQVTLIYNDDITPDSTITVTYDKPFGFYQPSRNGYEIIGWYLNDDFTGNVLNPSNLVDITDDIKLYAKWDIITYSIDYIDDFNVSNTNRSSFNIETATFSLTDLTKTGYTFEGWFDSVSFENRVSSIPTGTYKNYNLYAKWSPNQYKVTLQYNNNSTVDEIIVVTFDDLYNLSEPTRTGYLFEGWYYFDGSEEWLAYMPKINGFSEEELQTVDLPFDHVLYAKWVEGTTGLEFNLKSLNSEYYWEIIGDDKSINEVVIPASYFDIPVTTIGKQAFSGFTSMTSIIIPESIIRIGYRAFEDCTGLTRFNLPNSNYILLDSENNGTSRNTDNQMLKGCDNLEILTIPFVDYVWDPLYGYFGDTNEFDSVPTSLKTLILTAQTKIIFYDFSAYTLENLVIPDTVTTIDANAFRDMTSVELFVVANSKPSQWNSNWNKVNYDGTLALPVHWGGTWTYVNGIPTPKE